jgi:hypothetical protein
MFGKFFLVFFSFRELFFGRLSGELWKFGHMEPLADVKLTGEILTYANRLHQRKYEWILHYIGRNRTFISLDGGSGDLRAWDSASGALAWQWLPQNSAQKYVQRVFVNAAADADSTYFDSGADAKYPARMALDWMAIETNGGGEGGFQRYILLVHIPSGSILSNCIVHPPNVHSPNVHSPNVFTFLGSLLLMGESSPYYLKPTRVTAIDVAMAVSNVSKE